MDGHLTNTDSANPPAGFQWSAMASERRSADPGRSALDVMLPTRAAIRKKLAYMERRGNECMAELDRIRKRVETARHHYEVRAAQRSHELILEQLRSLEQQLPRLASIVLGSRKPPRAASSSFARALWQAAR